MTNFIALYRGETISGARIVALSADPQLVRDFAARLLESPPELHMRVKSLGEDESKSQEPGADEDDFGDLSF